MEESSRFWLVLRIAIAVASVPAWLFIRAAMPDDFSVPPKWHFPLVIIGFSFFAVVAWSIMRPDQEWRRPSWSVNPLELAKPLEGLHVSAWSFLLGAAGLLVVSMLRQPDDWTWVLPGSIGLGLLAGIHTVATHRVNNGP